MIQGIIRVYAIIIVFSLLLVFQASVIAQSPEATNNITVQTIESQSLTEKAMHKLSESWPWYISRASGLIAAVTLVVLMLSGIGQMTGHTFKFLSPITAWASHRAVGLVFAVSVLVHVICLLFDSYFKISIFELLIPWLSDYRQVTFLGINLGSIYIAMGILAFYLSIIIVITSLTIISKKPHFWKLVHLLSYIVIALVFFHALFIGTDLAHGWLRVVWIACGIFIFVAAVIRLKRARTT